MSVGMLPLTLVCLSASNTQHVLFSTQYNTGSISTADGSALVRLGNTTVVCGVKAEIAEPELDAGLQGFLGMFPILLVSSLQNQ